MDLNKIIDSGLKEIKDEKVKKITYQKVNMSSNNKNVKPRFKRHKIMRRSRINRTLTDADLINSFSSSYKSKVKRQLQGYSTNLQKVKNKNFSSDGAASLKEKFKLKFKSLEIPATIVEESDEDFEKLSFEQDNETIVKKVSNNVVNFGASTSKTSNNETIDDQNEVWDRVNRDFVRNLPECKVVDDTFFLNKANEGYHSFSGSDENEKMGTETDIKSVETSNMLSDNKDIKNEKLPELTKNLPECKVVEASLFLSKKKQRLFDLSGAEVNDNLAKTGTNSVEACNKMITGEKVKSLKLSEITLNSGTSLGISKTYDNEDGVLEDQSEVWDRVNRDFVRNLPECKFVEASFFLNKANKGLNCFSGEDIIESKGTEIKNNLVEVEKFNRIVDKKSIKYGKSPANNLPECKVVDETYFCKKTNERLNDAGMINKMAGKTEINENSVEICKSVIADDVVKNEKFSEKSHDNGLDRGGLFMKETTNKKQKEGNVIVDQQNIKTENYENELLDSLAGKITSDLFKNIIKSNVSYKKQMLKDNEYIYKRNRIIEQDRIENTPSLTKIIKNFEKDTGSSNKTAESCWLVSESCNSKENTATGSSLKSLVESETTVNLTVKDKTYNEIKPMKNYFFEMFQQLDEDELFSETCNKINSFKQLSTKINGSSSKKPNKSRTKFLNLKKRSNRVSPAAEAPKAENKKKSLFLRSCKNVKRSLKILKKSFISYFTYTPPFSCFMN